MCTHAVPRWWVQHTASEKPGQQLSSVLLPASKEQHGWFVWCGRWSIKGSDGFGVYDLRTYRVQFSGCDKLPIKAKRLVLCASVNISNQEDGVFGRCHFQLQSNTIPNPLEALALHSFWSQEPQSAPSQQIPKMLESPNLKPWHVPKPKNKVKP